MELSTAIRLIEAGVNKNTQPQTWADLGAGQGLFTRALSRQLSAKSVIYAIDTDAHALKGISIEPDIALHKVNADFISFLDDSPRMNGFLMANALHFVSDRLTFGKSLIKRMLPGGRLLLVEYDMDKPSQWVPFPLSKSALSGFSDQVGFASVTFLDEVPSVYNSSMIYSAVLKR
jgi:trans-aconitate methyltransferase